MINLVYIKGLLRRMDKVCKAFVQPKFGFWWFVTLPFSASQCPSFFCASFSSLQLAWRALPKLSNNSCWATLLITDTPCCPTAFNQCERWNCFQKVCYGEKLSSETKRKEVSPNHYCSRQKEGKLTQWKEKIGKCFFCLALQSAICMCWIQK